MRWRPPLAHSVDKGSCTVLHPLWPVACQPAHHSFTCDTFAGAFSPCLYCAQARAHPRQRLATCIPLWQSCVFALFHTAMDPQAADASMEELFGASGSVDCPSQGRDVPEASQIGQVQQQGKGNSQGQGTSGRNPRSQSGGGQEGSIRAEGPDLERSFQAGQTTARLVAQDAAAVADSHPGPGRADMARGGGKAREPPARDANQAGNLLEIRYLKSAIQNLGDEGLMEARSSGWRRRATGYTNSGARNRSVWWKTPSARLCGRRS